MVVRIEPDRELVNFLKSKLTDINSSRSGQWIFPDFPRVRDLGDASYPRVGVTIISNSSQPMGLIDTDVYEEITFQIDIVTKKGLLFTVTTTDEAMGTVAATSNTNRMTYEYLPNTVTNIKHDGTSYGTVTMKDTNSDFTAPASLAADNIEWSYSTGDLNFNATDLAGDVGEAITSTSILKLEGKKCCQYLAREIIKAIKTYWRDDLNNLINPVMINNMPVPIDEDLHLYRQVLEYKFNGFNYAEDISN